MTEAFQDRRNRKARERRAANPEHYRAIQKRSRDKRIASGANAAQNQKWAKANPERRMWHQAKLRAKRYGRDFNIEVSDIVIPTLCPVFKTPMERPSLDRFDNDLGYVKGNVRVISHRANCLKRDASLAEMEAVLRYMRDTSA